MGNPGEVPSYDWSEWQGRPLLPPMWSRIIGRKVPKWRQSPLTGHPSQVQDVLLNRIHLEDGSAKAQLQGAS